MRWALIGLACGAGFAAAAEPDPDRTHRYPSTAVNTLERAGNPQEVSRLAAPGRTAAYSVGWVGGGLPTLFPSRRDGRDLANDGTWGSDYTLFGRRPGRIFLGWAHDRTRQPQPGPYKIDGPHVPDPLAKHPVQKLLKGREEKEKGEEGGE